MTNRFNDLSYTNPVDNFDHIIYQFPVLVNHRKKMNTDPVYAQRAIVNNDYAKAIRILSLIKSEMKRCGWSQDSNFSINKSNPCTIGSFLKYATIEKSDTGTSSLQQKAIVEYYLNKAINYKNYSFKTYQDFDNQDFKRKKIGISTLNSRVNSSIEYAYQLMLQDLNLGSKTKFTMFYV
jgi:hypothetical protein